MTDNFFKDETGETEEPEKVKVGETEFSPEELQELIGAGQKLKEIETKQGQPIDEVLTSWGKRGEVIGQLKKEKEEALVKLDKYENPPTPEQVDKEKIKEQVISEAREYGLLTKDEAQEMFVKTYEERRAGERLLASVKRTLREAKSDEKPTTTPEKLLEFMADPANPKDPEKAYKIMFEKELEEWKEARINQVKKPNMFTETTSTAGAKEFIPPKLTNREDLRNALRVSIRGEGGQ